LKKRTVKLAPVARPPIPDFYSDGYLPGRRASSPRKVRRDKPVVAMVPERFESGHLSPCAFIRLLQPLDHPDIGSGFRIHLDDPVSVLARRADVIVTQRHAVGEMVGAEALVRHARSSGAKLIFDLDDDLLSIPPDHADAAVLRPRAKVVRFLVDSADAVWVSSRGLMKRLARIRPDATLIENGLDERIWAYGPAPARFQPDPLRILCMGTGTHHDDLAMVMPGLVRLKAEYGERVVIDIVGMSDEMELPKGIRRLGPPLYATQSYPAFVHWINTVTERWHIGLAPLLDTPFNRCKSSIKTMDYAAMGMVVLASDMPVYRGSLADGPVGHLVENDPHAWYEALEWLLRDQAMRQTLERRARAAFLEQASLGSQAAARLAAWKLVLS
jgi:glycosyltransferase involved in cell wall biosynthesis